VVSTTLRRISKNMPSFPKELLYVHRDNGGMGSLDDRGIYAADKVADNSPDAINFMLR
jgi:hypothetical protein